MKLKHILRRKSSYKSFLYSYIFILLIPLVIASVAYTESVRIVKTDQMHNNYVMLDRSKNIVGNYFDEVDRRISQLSLTPEVKYLMDMNPIEEDSSGIYDILQASSALKYYTKKIFFEDRLLLFFKGNEIVMHSGGINMGFRFYYNNYMTYGNLDYEQWTDQFFQEYNQRKILPASNITIDKVTKSYITYIQTLPMQYGGKPKGTLVDLIDESSITSVLKDTLGDKKGTVYIADKNGRIITSIVNGDYAPEIINQYITGSQGSLMQSVHGEDMLLTYTANAGNSLKFVAAIPYSEVMNKVNYIRTLYIYIVIVSIILGILLALFFSYRNIKPFRILVNTITGSKIGEIKPGQNEAGILNEGINRLLSSNHELKMLVENQKIIEKNTLLKRIFNGEYKSEATLEQNIRAYELAIEGKSYAAILLKKTGAAEAHDSALLDTEYSWAQLNDSLRRNEYGIRYLHVTNENEIWLLISSDNSAASGFEASIKAFIQDILHTLETMPDLDFSIGIGGTKERLIDVSFSKWEAEQALKHTLPDNPEKVSWYMQNHQTFNSIYFSVGIGQQLTNFIINGNTEEVHKLLELLYDNNFNLQRSSVHSQRLFLFNLYCVLVNIVAEIDYKPNLDLLYHDLLLYSEKDNISLFTALKEHFLSLCGYFSSNRLSCSNKVIQEIIEYLNNNYMDNNISGYGIASAHDMSESYFSQIFKDYTGKTFTSYLEAIRLQKACEMLASGSISIEEIALKVGYSSSHTFRRAFKRSIGISPSEYTP